MWPLNLAGQISSLSTWDLKTSGRSLERGSMSTGTESLFYRFDTGQNPYSGVC